MNKKMNKSVAGLLMVIMVLMLGMNQFSLEVNAVTPSETKYDVYINGGSVYLCNEKNIGSEVGTEYFMTYTVKDVKSSPEQHALVGTADKTREWPYEQGGILRGSNDDKHLLDEGATYYIKFSIALGGFRYNITRQKDGKLEDLYLEDVYGEATDNMKYFGLWLGVGHAYVDLTDVRFYDSKGNDLGAYLKEGQGVVLKQGAVLKKDTEVDHCYDIVIDNQYNIALSHVKVPTSSKVYIEYTVESAEYAFNQEGVAISNIPDNEYPHSKGMLKSNSYDKPSDSVMLLEVGADYIISLERTKSGFDVYVQKTKNGVTAIHMFEQTWSPWYDETSQIYSLWFGEGCYGSFKLTNFKCYDGNKNNLGVQCNKNATILHYGLMEDYSGCEATYYCEENENSFALYENQKLKFTKDNATHNGTYQISRNIMTTNINDKSEEYDYLFKRITDEDGVEYERLYNYKVSFVTGTEEEIETQNLSNEYGYMAMRPNDPKLEGYDFEGWYLIDGTEFDFNKIVTESTTLYAKYSGDGGVAFLAGQEIDEPSEMTPAIIVGGFSMLLVAVTVSVIFMVRGAKNGRKK